MWARPDFWEGLDNSFSILLAFSEIALLAVGLTFVMANGDIDLSVGSVLALSGATAAVIMKDTASAVRRGRRRDRRRVVGRRHQRLADRYVGLPAFIATLGMFYMARGVGSSIVAGPQLTGFPESFNLIGRSLFEVLNASGMAPDARTGGSRSQRRSACRRSSSSSSRPSPESCSPIRRFGQKVLAIGGNERAASFAGINTRARALHGAGDFRRPARLSPA